MPNNLTRNFSRILRPSTFCESQIWHKIPKTSSTQYTILDIEPSQDNPDMLNCKLYLMVNYSLSDFQALAQVYHVYHECTREYVNSRIHFYEL